MRRVLVTGGNGFLGRYVCRKLRERGDTVLVPRRSDYDLRDQRACELLFREEPQIVIHLAANVGGIGYNQRFPGATFYDNAQMGLNVVESCRRHGVERLVFVSTVCAYPKHCLAPFQESSLWGGYPEETNAPYGVAKKAIHVMLDAYRQEYGLNSAVLLMANLYGPGDEFGDRSHVIPALIKRFCTSDPVVECWGTGQASREFLYVEDAAEAVLRASEINTEPINVGNGVEIRISELAELIARECGFRGTIRWDHSKPDGQPRRCLDVSRASELLGWTARVPLRDGIRETVRWYRESVG